MTMRKKAVLLMIPLLFIAGIVVMQIVYSQEGFSGSRVKNPDAYLLDIERMNGTDLHTLELRRGDALRVHFETLKGALYMEIKAPDGTALYSGNGKEAADFSVNIPQDGAYTVLVEARHAKGTIHIQLEEQTT